MSKQQLLFITLTLFTLTFSTLSSSASDEWSQFRGPNASGVSDDTNLPVNFGPDQNVVWKTALPPGHSSPVLAGDRIFITAHETGKLFVICLDRGAVTESRFMWRYQKSLPNTPSPLFYKDALYLMKEGGILTSLDPATGAVLKQGRLREAPGDYYSSPVAADGKIFTISEEGKVTVLKAGGDWEVLATNDLDDICHATPAIAGGKIYLRTRNTLYCFGKREQADLNND